MILQEYRVKDGYVLLTANELYDMLTAVRDAYYDTADVIGRLQHRKAQLSDLVSELEDLCNTMWVSNE